MTKIEAAYLAGLVDGEGCISLKRQKSTNRWGFQLVAKLVVVNTSSVLCALHKHTGLGSIRSKIRTNKRHKEAFEWKLNSNDCRKLLPEIIPYLWIKKHQAEELLKYLVLSQSIPRRSVSRLEQYKVAVLEIANRIDELNWGQLAEPVVWGRHSRRIFCAYLAGLIDGEGCISISRTFVNGKHYFYPRISVANCDDKLCQVAKRCGRGSVILRKVRTVGWRNCWIWACQSVGDCRALLEMVLPYLKIKKQQAVVVRDAYSRGFDTCHEVVQQLNKKGS